MRAPTEARHPEQNQLLRALPRSEYRRLLPDIQEVSLANGRVLFEARERIAHVYFPQHCVVSLLTVVDDEPGVEVAIVGNEGMVGLSVFLGAASATNRAVSQVPDGARRLTVAAFRRALSRGPALRRILLRYADTMLSQIAQSAACIQRHPSSSAARAGCSWRTTAWAPIASCSRRSSSDRCWTCGGRRCRRRRVTCRMPAPFATAEGGSPC
jgi:CRP-like cAMP-binding protein